MIEYRPTKRLDLYAGALSSQRDRGAWRAATSTIRISGPTAGLQFQF